MPLTVLHYGTEVHSGYPIRLLNASLRFFILAVVSTINITIHNQLFSSAAANLTARLRKLSFKSLLRQDSTIFLFRFMMFSHAEAVL